MHEHDESAAIIQLRAKLVAQQKTIEILMNAAEQRTSEGPSATELLSHNLNLERIVQHKTRSLQRQGEELKTTLQELQRTQAWLIQAQKLESVGHLAAGIAHEINTPTQFIGSNINFLEESFAEAINLIEALYNLLRSVSSRESAAEEIVGKAEDLLEHFDWKYLENEIPKAIQQSKEGINRVTSIVQAMKEFSHPGSREKISCDLNRIIETTITVASNEWKYCAEIQKNLDPKLPQVDCLANEIGQVVLNLLINASHAIAENNKGSSQKGLITISTCHCIDAAQICIEDSGTGIPEAIQTRIFDPFFTTKIVGKGTGQGLAIAHDVIVTKHGGSISFTSETGKGTSFIILLPIKAAT